MKHKITLLQSTALSVPFTALSFQRRLESSSFKTFLILIMLLIAAALTATTLTSQSFEATTSDTWNYTANPEGMTRLVWWGRSDQAMGGANAQNGSWYWASWDLDNAEHTLTFANQALVTGYIHSLSFWYYTNGLNPATDYSKYCVEYDTGTSWNNWVTLNADTDTWTHVTLDIPVYATIVRLKVAAKYDGFSKYAHWDNFSITNTPAPPTAPLVYNTSVAQRTDGSKIVDIYYDLFDANNDLSTISIQLSSDGGTSFSAFPNPANLSGDLGDNIANGTGKHIVWNAGGDGIIYNANQYVIRMFAEDNSEPPIPDRFVLVEGGTFSMGNALGGGNSNELPVHEVTLSSYLIGKYKVTQNEWQAIMGSNPASGAGVGDNYPVYSVSWYSAVKYCNLRSMSEGLTPVYSISGSTNPANWGSEPNANWDIASCNWNANGYRLPTEAEWEFAARGATNNPDYLYSGSDDINAVARYDGNNSPYGTKPVGTKAPNGIGTYDMSGNLCEWCWDWFSISYYANSLSNNPTGPASGSLRVLRSGAWAADANECRVSHKYVSGPSAISWGYGFRVCRSLDSFVLVEGGNFNNDTSDVTVSSFYIDKYETTQAGYQAIMGTNPSIGNGVSDKHPVYNVSWFNAIEYCNRRSIQEGYTPCYSYSTYGSNPSSWPAGWNTVSTNHTNVSCSWTANGYRLPTEAEWEFASRGGSQTTNYTYSGSNDIEPVAWYYYNSENTTHTIGSKTANNLGLYDMSGNVWEWTWDIFADYPSGSQNNPTGAMSGNYRVRRGGSWDTMAYNCTVSVRSTLNATSINSNAGFRCVRTTH